MPARATEEIDQRAALVGRATAASKVMDPPLQQSVRAVARELVWISPPHGAQCSHASGRRHCGRRDGLRLHSLQDRPGGRRIRSRPVGAGPLARPREFDRGGGGGGPAARAVRRRRGAGRRRGRRPGRRVDRAPWGGAGGAPAPSSAAGGHGAKPRRRRRGHAGSGATAHQGPAAGHDARGGPAGGGLLRHRLPDLRPRRRVGWPGGRTCQRWARSRPQHPVHHVAPAAARPLGLEAPRSA